MINFKQFTADLEQIGTKYYHHTHPFHLKMHRGELSLKELQTWAINRYYYQSTLPKKDAIILSKSDDSQFRKIWIKRIHDQDGMQHQSAGLERWLKLTDGLGLHRNIVTSCEHVLPAVRYATDAYLHFVKDKTLIEAVASSFTELFSGKLMAIRVEFLQQHYPYLKNNLDYFTNRIPQTEEDINFALKWCYDRIESENDLKKIQNALIEKCQILWAVLDAIDHHE